jgi:hypothetical protein
MLGSPGRGERGPSGRKYEEPGTPGQAVCRGDLRLSIMMESEIKNAHCLKFPNGRLWRLQKRQWKRLHPMLAMPACHPFGKRRISDRDSKRVKGLSSCSRIFLFLFHFFSPKGKGRSRRVEELGKFDRFFESIVAQPGSDQVTGHVPYVVG